MSKDIEFTVIATAQVPISQLDPDDCEVPGEHDFYLPADCVSWTEGEQATAVLDMFHNGVAVSVLDDFDFSVFNSDGKEICEDHEE